jgi:hypothetical protein
MEILRAIFNLLARGSASACSRISLSIYIVLLQVQFLSAQPSPEYQIKAVFLFNFTQFVEWPSTAFERQNAPLVIGILGKDPFGSYLDETIKGEEVNGHPLVVQRFSRAEDVKKCHILFITPSDKDQLRNIFDGLTNQPILTVGDVVNFSKSGGMIRFFTENNKIRIRINLDIVKDADLIISSKLLRMAEIVSSK